MKRPNAPSLGKNLKRLRKERGWSMIKMCDVIGIPQSSLSKLENGLMSLNYDKLVEVAARLDIDVGELFRTEEADGRGMAPSARIAIDRAADRKLVAWRNIRHRQLATEVKDRLMIPTYAEISPESKAQELELGDYYGERFIYVLDGAVQFHSEFYEPYLLQAGDSAYFDIRMRHSFSVAKARRARCIVVTASEDRKFMEIERALASQHLTNVAEFEHLQRPASVRRK